MIDQIKSRVNQKVSQPSETSSKASVSSEGRTAVKSSSIPSQIYHRLGLRMPRWLFWFVTGVVGVTLSGLLVSTLALWTPLWSDIDRTEDELGWASDDATPSPLPGDLWNNISEYQLIKPMNILVLGIEPVRGAVDGSADSFGGKSDAMLLLRINPNKEERTIRVLSIPRDTMISIPDEKGLTKVSEANTQGGAVLAARVISRTLSNAPIDRYVRLSSSGFRELVDSLGGIEVFVPKTMVYRDRSQGLSINLVKGWQNLNGEQALQFARYREEGEGDLGRVQRQQALLKGLRQRLSSPTVLPKLPQLVRMMNKHVDTNLKLEEMMALANFALNLERDNFEMTTLPGIFSRLSRDPDSYWLNLNGRARLLDEYAGVSISGIRPDSRPAKNLKIAVQNTTGQPKLTKKVINYLKKQGFTKVSAIEEWRDPHSKTQIIIQKGNKKAGEELQEILGLGEIEVSSAGDIESDLTIRIGKDWQK